MLTSPRRRVHHAFTLIELLVVISIIVLLISILLPALSKARKSVEQLTCLSNQRQVVTAIFTYAGDHGGYLPYRPDQRYWDSPGTLAVALVGDPGSSSFPIQGYFPHDGQGFLSTEVMQCPADPNKWGPASYPRSYLYRQSHNGLPVSNGGQQIRLGASKGKDPSGLSYESTLRWLTLDTAHANPATLQVPTTWQKTTIAGPPSPDNISIDSFWHEDGVNVAYEDGHAEWVRFGRAVGERN